MLVRPLDFKKIFRNFCQFLLVNRFSLLLTLIVLLAFYVRTVGVDFGLPFQYHPDEYYHIKKTIRLLGGEYFLEGYNHPPFGVYVAVGVLKLASLFFPISETTIWLQAQLVLRLVSVVCSTLSVWLLFKLAKNYLDSWYALAAALLYAVLPITVIQAKYGVSDTMLSFLFLVNCILALKLYRTPTSIHYFLGGVALAIAIGTKYNGIFLFFPYVVAHTLVYTTRKTLRPQNFFQVKKIALFCISLILTLVIIFPLVPFQDWQKFIQSIIFEQQHLFVVGHWWGVPLSGLDYFYVFHFLRSILPATGVFLLSILVIGMGYIVLKRKNPIDYIIISLIIPYYVVVEYVYKIPVIYPHYILPLVSLYVLYAVFFLKQIINFLKATMKFYGTIVGLAFFLLLLLFPCYKTTLLLATIKPDTRDTMANWIQSNIPQHATIAMQPPAAYYPKLSSTEFSTLWLKEDQMNFDYITTSATDYILVSSLVYDWYLEHPNKNPTMATFYQTLFEQGTLLHTEIPSYETYSIHNPTLRLYTLVQ